MSPFQETAEIVSIDQLTTDIYRLTAMAPDIAGSTKPGQFVMIKVDLTRKGNPDHERLLRQFQVKGVPTVVFLDQYGKERGDLRLVDFLPAEQFLLRMVDFKKKNSQ